MGMEINPVIKLMKLLSENGINVAHLEMGVNGIVKAQFTFDKTPLREKAKEALYDYGRSLCVPGYTKEQRIQLLQQLFDEIKAFG